MIDDEELEDPIKLELEKLNKKMSPGVPEEALEPEKEIEETSNKEIVAEENVGEEEIEAENAADEKFSLTPKHIVIFFVVCIVFGLLIGLAGAGKAGTPRHIREIEAFFGLEFQPEEVEILQTEFENIKRDVGVQESEILRCLFNMDYEGEKVEYNTVDEITALVKGCAFLSSTGLSKLL